MAAHYTQYPAASFKTQEISDLFSNIKLDPVNNNSMASYLSGTFYWRGAFRSPSAIHAPALQAASDWLAAAGPPDISDDAAFAIVCAHRSHVKTLAQYPPPVGVNNQTYLQLASVSAMLVALETESLLRTPDDARLIAGTVGNRNGWTDAEINLIEEMRCFLEQSFLFRIISDYDLLLPSSDELYTPL
jgi:hypothetical protein